MFDATDAGDLVTLTANDMQLGEQLLNDCVAEIKRSRTIARKGSQGDASPRAAAQAALDELRYQLGFKVNIKDYQSGVAILNATPAQQAAIVVVAMTAVVKDRYNDTTADRLGDELLKSLLRRKLPYDDAAIVKILTLVVADSITYTTLPVLSILSNVERHVEQNGMSKSVRQRLKKLTKTYYPEACSADERKIGVRITALLDRQKSHTAPGARPRVAQSTESPLVSFEFQTGEAWTNAMLVELGQITDDSRNNWQQLLEHCGTAKSSKPTKKWLNKTKTLLDPIGLDEFVSVVRPALAAIGQPGESQRFNYGGYIQFGEVTQIHDTHVDLLRGLVWATSLFDDETLIGVVGDVAEKCFQKIREVGPRCPKVGNACLIALSSLASESAVAQLGRLKSRAKHVSTRKQIARAFVRAADVAGMTEADLVELGVPSFGLTEPGTMTERFGAFTAEASIDANQKPGLCWVKSDGKRQKTVPAAVKSEHSAALKALKKKLKDIDTLMPSVRDRIEQLFLSDRSWSLVDFRRRFLDHPIVGVVARRLIWNLELAGTWTPVIWYEGQLVDANDRTLEHLEAQARVTIWHPLQALAEEVLQWRQWLAEHHITQPFKQAHREVYLLTDAERETGLYSNRFASHIVRQHQLAALCQQRGWRYDLQGDWDSWNAPFLELPQYELRVEFFVDPQGGRNDVTEALIYTHLSTDQVRFLPMPAGEAINLDRPLRLADIPPLVFSEVMRDVDLFVGVSSIGNDPHWHDGGGEDVHADYWQAFSFGELSQTAHTRKQILQDVVPRLTIAKHCRFEAKFLVVEGKLRTYKIHLGSGNVLMSPNDQYLCIVQKRGSGTRRTENIYLPFAGDNTLSLILSKAFLLADDDQIKDQTIVNQIRLDRD